MHTNKNLTPDFLRVEKMQKLDGDITQNFFVFVCFQGCTVSLIVSSQLLPCIWIKGLHPSFHLPDNHINNHFDCLEVTKAPDTEFINPYPLPTIIHFLQAEQLKTRNYEDPLCPETLAELFTVLFAEFCKKIIIKFLIFRIL